MKFILALCSALIYCRVASTTPQSTLELVQVFFRHGSRTPESKDLYPLDIYKEADFYPFGWGQLTNAGKLRAYTLGQLLRKRYDHFLGRIYNPEEIYAQSTDFDRTKMSLILVLAGLYPPSEIMKWHPSLDWQPATIHTEKAKCDYFLRRPIHYCPAYLKELERVFKEDKRITDILADNQQYLEYIATNTGKSMTSLMDVFGLYQTLNAEENFNMTLPSWTHEVYPKIIHELAGYQCYFENANKILKRLNGGRSLQHILFNMAERIQQQNNKKIYLYSGHENNVVNILSALNLFKSHVPKYSAAVIFELHKFPSQPQDEYKIKTLYIRDVYDDKHEPEVKQLQGCDLLCPYNQFIEITRSVVPVNYTAECGSTLLLDV